MHIMRVPICSALIILLLALSTTRLFSGNLDNKPGYLPDDFYFGLGLNSKYNEYYICAILYPTDDTHIYGIFSVGTYTLSEKMITLHDNITGVDFEGELTSDSTVVFTKACHFMKNSPMEFGFYEDRYAREEFLGDLDEHKASKLREEHTTSERIEFSSGVYVWPHRGGDIYDMELEINTDGTYKYYMYELLVSKGGWHRENNIMVLTENDSKANYYLLIKNKSLQSMLLPADTHGQVLIKKSVAQYHRMY